MTCACGSGADYAACCGPLHAGASTAVTAEQLMRSRYSAYALRLGAYVARTWHPSTRPATPIVLDDDITWRRLQIVDVERGGAGDDTGVVEFRAAFRGSDGVGMLHERSRFVREGADWTYLDGTELP